ncbi:BT_2262 family domain-containing protein [Polaribacter sp. L3A8]|uniref:BT_2262 family domain-containing protein n=1 Tax=Polaribacter sp. L3A8 TaxID=2686361 RepID=UPI00131B5A7A|nr:BT_2262 family domain-containing protein [Polaribacter sp. L3A8]
MKKISIYTTILAVALMFNACVENDSANISGITNFAVFTLSGDQEVLLKNGTEYLEPGATAEEAGSAVDVTTTISAGLYRGLPFSKDVSDIYTVSYSAVNQDGFLASAGRTVIIADSGDLVNDLSGLYISSVTRNDDAPDQYQNMKYVMIWKKSDGIYQISDGIGAWYELGRVLGTAYGAPGATIKVNGPNDFSIANKDFDVKTFGGAAEMLEFNVNAAAKTIDFKTDWRDGDFIFEVHLEQVQF